MLAKKLDSIYVKAFIGGKSGSEAQATYILKNYKKVEK